MSVLNFTEGPIPPDTLVRVLMKEHGLDYHSLEDMTAFFKLTADLASSLGDKLEYSEEDIKNVYDLLNNVIPDNE